jgi:hypothetical protein
MFVPEIPSQISLGNGQIFLNESAFALAAPEVVLDGEPDRLESATLRIHPDDYDRFVEEWLWLLAGEAAANTDHSAAALIRPPAPRAMSYPDASAELAGPMAAAFDYPSAFADVRSFANAGAPGAGPIAMSFEYPAAEMGADPWTAGVPMAMAMEYPMAAAGAAEAVPAARPAQGVSITAVGSVAGVRRVIRFADVRSCRAFADDATVAVSLAFAHGGAGVAVLDAA